MFLLVAEHCLERDRISSFKVASHGLRSDREFMLEAMRLDQALFACATRDCVRDEELLLVLFGGSAECLRPYSEASTSISINGSRLLAESHVSCGLDAFQEFRCSVLLGMRDRGSSLSL